jgi:hypothetical protein
MDLRDASYRFSILESFQSVLHTDKNLVTAKIFTPAGMDWMIVSQTAERLMRGHV